MGHAYDRGWRTTSNSDLHRGYSAGSLSTGNRSSPGLERGNLGRLYDIIGAESLGPAPLNIFANRARPVRSSPLASFVGTRRGFHTCSGARDTVYTRRDRSRQWTDAACFAIPLNHRFVMPPQFRPRAGALRQPSHDSRSSNNLFRDAAFRVRCDWRRRASIRTSLGDTCSTAQRQPRRTAVNLHDTCFLPTFSWCRARASPERAGNNTVYSARQFRHLRARGAASGDLNSTIRTGTALQPLFHARRLSGDTLMCRRRASRWLLLAARNTSAWWPRTGWLPPFRQRRRRSSSRSKLRSRRTSQHLFDKSHKKKSMSPRVASSSTTTDLRKPAEPQSVLLLRGLPGSAATR